MLRGKGVEREFEGDGMVNNEFVKTPINEPDKVLGEFSKKGAIAPPKKGIKMGIKKIKRK